MTDKRPLTSCIKFIFSVSFSLKTFGILVLRRLLIVLPSHFHLKSASCHWKDFTCINISITIFIIIIIIIIIVIIIILLL